MREAIKERFYYVVGEHSLQGMCRCCQHRAVVPRSSSMEKVLDGMRSTPHARSYVTHDHKKVRGLPDSKVLKIWEVVSHSTKSYEYCPGQNVKFAAS